MLMLTLLVSSPQTTTTSALSIKMSACSYYFFSCFVQELFPFFKADVLTMFYKYNEWVVALSKSKKCKRNKKMYLRNRLLSRLTIFCLGLSIRRFVVCILYLSVCAHFVLALKCLNNYAIFILILSRFFFLLSFFLLLFLSLFYFYFPLE